LTSRKEILDLYPGPSRLPRTHSGPLQTPPTVRSLRAGTDLAGPAQTPLTLVDLRSPSAFPTVIVGRVFLLFLLLLRPSMLTLAYAGLMPPRLACSPAGSCTAPSNGAGRRRVGPIRGAAAPPLLLLLLALGGGGLVRLGAPPRRPYCSLPSDFPHFLPLSFLVAPTSS